MYHAFRIRVTLQHLGTIVQEAMDYFSLCMSKGTITQYFQCNTFQQLAEATEVIGVIRLGVSLSK